jgi:DNA replication and repair protein RecF
VICICGKNGSGKTNLLDAVYTLCYTKSYFSATILPTIQKGTDGFRIEGEFKKDKHFDQVLCKYKNGKKEISLNQVPYEKHVEHIGKFAAVMVAPDDIELINESSELRRKFVDGILSQCDKTYLDALLNYQKVLLQRNAWLKMRTSNTIADTSLLEYYNSIISPLGNYIFQARELFLSSFKPLLNKYYNLLANGNESINIKYQSDLQAAPLELLLQKHLEQDIRYERTLRGIHKDELNFQMNDQPIKGYGSQGQKKSFLFALKLAQYEFLKTKMNISPILLLDDVFEKLDQQRMESLLNIIRNPIFGQVIITDTHESRIQNAFGPNQEIGIIRL